MSRPHGITPVVIAKSSLLLLSILLFSLKPLPAFVQHDTVRDHHLRSFIYIASLLVWTLSAVVYWLVWKGQDAGRWLLMIGAVLALYSLRTLHPGAIASSQLSPTFWYVGAALSIVNAAFGLFLLWYLNTAPVRAWFQVSRDSARAAKPYLRST